MSGSNADTEAIARALLVADVALAQLVGDRIFPGVMKQGAPLPGLVISRAGNAPVQSLDGDVSNLDQVRLRVACYAADYKGARALAKAARNALRSAQFTFEGDFHAYDDETQSHGINADFYYWENPI